MQAPFHRLITAMKKSRIVLALALAGVSAAAAWAQQPGISRTDLLKRELSVPGRDVVQVRVDFASGASAAEHRHPGEEVAYVLEGTLEYRLDGGAPIVLHAGQSLFIPAGVLHSARNAGDGEASELATYVVDPNKPLVVRP
jgi:quercetin dioxygenase-like cupin family protein